MPYNVEGLIIFLDVVQCFTPETTISEVSKLPNTCSKPTEFHNHPTKTYIIEIILQN
jgi:hypothetical protein